MIPTIGRIVHYRLTEQDVDQINTDRIRSKRDRDSNLATREATIGNQPQPGDVFPLLITRVWGSTPSSAVNGQVLLDGNDSLWVTSRSQSPAELVVDAANGTWYEPPRVQA